MSFILVVEDNPTNMELVTTLLEEEGHEVITATNGAAGLSLATERLPDLILMDVSLPLINGLDATGILKREGQTQDIPIIALTAHAMRGDREQCLRAGCDDYETKPLNGPRLMEKIRQHVEARSPDFVRHIEQSRQSTAQVIDFNPYKQQAEEAEQKISTLADALASAKEQLSRASTEYKERLAYLHDRVSTSMSTNKEKLDAAEQECNALREQLTSAAQAREQLLEELAALQQAHTAALDRATSAEATAEAAQQELAAQRAAAETLAQQPAEAPEPTADPAALEALRSEHAEAIATLEASHAAALKQARRETTRRRKLAAEKRLKDAQEELESAKEREQTLQRELIEARRAQSNVPIEAKLLQAELLRKSQQLDQARSALAHLQEAVRSAVDASFREAMFGTAMPLTAAANK